ncbi:MAG TPA: hypothetical protein VLJ17_09310, partial [Xanthobacteraceae bacterium]|nr:hypothetical protein [Xanthobacteraceae bacterium]
MAAEQIDTQRRNKDSSMLSNPANVPRNASSRADILLETTAAAAPRGKPIKERRGSRCCRAPGRE